MQSNSTQCTVTHKSRHRELKHAEELEEPSRAAYANLSTLRNPRNPQERPTRTRARCGLRELGQAEDSEDPSRAAYANSSTLEPSRAAYANSSTLRNLSPFEFPVNYKGGLLLLIHYKVRTPLGNPNRGTT